MKDSLQNFVYMIKFINHERKINFLILIISHYGIKFKKKTFDKTYYTQLSAALGLALPSRRYTR